jgi:type IV pilus assembly protein PilB
MGIRYLNSQRKRLGDYLVELGFITQEQLDSALKEQKEKGGKLGSILIQMGYLSEDILLAILGKQSGIAYVSIEEYGEIPPEAIEAVPETIANKQLIIPLKKEGNLLTIATADPLNVLAVDDLKLLTGCDIRMVVASDSEIKEGLRKYYGGKTKKKKHHVELEQAVSEIKMDDIPEASFETEFTKGLTYDVEEEGESAPAIKLTNMILSDAASKGASDIHIEPMRNKIMLRFRIDGVLQIQPSPPKNVYSALASRLKVMSEMDITERRVPQDGRTKIMVDEKEIDIRVSSIPTTYGEKLVLRLLDSKGIQLGLDKLGFDEKEKELFISNIKAPQGLILVTGPTGSGKSTTLYSAISILNSPERNIVTIEDPVEYLLPGVNQVQAKPDIGLTFANGLRAFLRQDPDVILVGEIRDKETAEIAANASLTGHVVFATLHTNDAASTVIRLLNMNVEPVLISATLKMVVAQRLLRRICTNCRQPYEIKSSEIESMGVKLNLASGGMVRMFKGKGCEFCANTGYKGRVGIYEIMELNEEIRTLIVKRSPPHEIRAATRKMGLETLREVGLKKLFAGLTTLEEVLRVTTADEEAQ